MANARGQHEGRLSGDQTLVGKVALVTGAGSGIGRACAMALATAGARIVVADCNAEAAQETASNITSQGGQAHALTCDVTRADQVAAAIEQTQALYGRLDVIHNNAGIEVPSVAAMDLAEADFDRMVAVNLKGCWLCLTHSMAHMKRSSRSGVVINTASVAGLTSIPGMLAYGAVKAAVISMTRTAAAEMASLGVRVNCICPGFIETPMLDRLSASNLITGAQMADCGKQNLIGSVDDVAEAVVWLASDASRFVNGHAFVIDGGLLSQPVSSLAAPSRDRLRQIIRERKQEMSA